MKAKRNDWLRASTSFPVSKKLAAAFTLGSGLSFLSCAYATDPLPPDKWPKTKAQAVQEVIKALTPTQRGLVKGTSKDNLFMLQPEWGEDIEELLVLDGANKGFSEVVCGKPCKVKEATLLLMEAAWDQLTQ